MSDAEWIFWISVDLSLRIVVALVLAFFVLVLMDLDDPPYTEAGWRRATKGTRGPIRWAWVLAYKILHRGVRKSDERGSEGISRAGGASGASALGGGHDGVLSKRPGIPNHRKLSDGAGGAGAPASHRGEDQDEKPEDQEEAKGAAAEGEVQELSPHGAPHDGASARRRGRPERPESGGLGESEYESEFWKELVRRGKRMGL